MASRLVDIKMKPPPRPVVVDGGDVSATSGRWVTGAAHRREMGGGRRRRRRGGGAEPAAAAAAESRGGAVLRWQINSYGFREARI